MESDKPSQLKKRIKALEKENEQLKQSGFLHQKIVENLPLGIQVFDREGYSYEMNPAQKQLLGLPNMEEGIDQFNVLTDAYSEAMGANKKYEKVYRGETYEHEFEYDLGAKENKWNTKEEKRIFHESLFPIKDEKGKVKYAVAVLQDKTEERNAEKALKERKDLLQRVFESSFDLIALADLEGNFTLVGKSHEILGYGTDYLIGKNVLDFVHPDDAAYVNEEFAHFLKTGKDRMVEYRNKCFDGTYLWFETIGSILRDEKGNPEQILFNTRNITERKEVEEALRESEARFQKMLGVVPDMISIQNTEMDILYSNWKGFAAVPKSRRILNTKCYKTYRDFDDICPDCLAKSVLEIRKPLHEETCLPDGKWFDIRVIPILDKDNNVEMFMEWVRDITDRKQAEEVLRSNYALLQIAGETARFGGWSVDLEKNVATWSDAVADIHEVQHGYAPPVEEAINFYAPEWHDKIKQVFNDCAQKGVPYDEEMEIITANGKRLWVRTNGRAEKNENGKIIKVQGSFQDITDRKKAEKALQESEEKMRSIYRVAPAGIGVVVNRVLKEVNPRLCDMTGYTREELIEKNAQILYPSPEEYEFVGKEKYEQIRKTGTGKVETLWQKKDGTIINVLLASTPIDKNDYFKGVTFTALDITDRKRAEMIKELQYNIARATITTRNLNELFDSVQNELNSIIDARNFVIARYNEETGMLSSLVDKDEMDDIPEWPAKNSLTGYLIKQNRPLLLQKKEILHLREEGIIELIGTTSEAWLGVPLKVEGEIFGAVVVQNYDKPNAYDQTSIEIMELVAHELSMFIDRQRTEEVVNKLSRAVEQSSVSVMITNREGAIEYVNPFFTELTGYSFEDVKGKNPGILKSGHQSAAFYKELWDTILSGNDWEGEFLNKKKNGELYWVKAVISTIVNSEGAITNFVGINEDITDRKKAEKLLQERNEEIKAQNEEYENINEELRQTNEELLEAKERAEESDRLKSAFLANMSHEIRTPMNGIMGFSQMLQEKEFSQAKQRKFLDIIHSRASHLLNIINDIVDVSKIEANQLTLDYQDFCLNDVMKELYRVYKNQFNIKGKSQIQLKLNQSLEDDKSFIYSDPSRFRQIMDNLLNNALKFTYEGSIEFGYEFNSEGQLLFYVKDTGIGITRKEQEYIFERFRQSEATTSRSHEGTGLGLTISRNLVELMGGQMGVESKEGEGSVFYFTLPYKTRRKTVNKESTKELQDQPFGESRTILIIEDDPTSLEYMKEMLEPGGFEVLVCKTGEEGYEAFLNNPEINLILMDIKLPDTTGLELTRKIRASDRRSDVPIIAQTAYAMSDDAKKSIDAGCNDYIRKPIAKKKLFIKMGKYI